MSDQISENGPIPEHGAAYPGTEVKSDNAVTPSTKAAEPLYRGFTGDITSTDDLVGYTKSLETMLVANRNKQEEPGAFTAPVAPAPTHTRAETFEDVIYSDPARAKEILLNEWDRKEETRKLVEKRQNEFWNDFYKKNVDLKDLSHVVQSVFKRDRSEIEQFPNNERVAEHIAKEARDLVGLVKSKTGVTETVVPSGSAVTFPSSGEPGAARPAQVQKTDFASQILRMRKRK